MRKNIAIIGASGIVGRTVLKILKERNLDKNNFFLFASKENDGLPLYIGRKKYITKSLSDQTFKKTKFDYALFCTREEVSGKYVSKFLKNGAKVIDFSSLYRKEFPLIVPEINFQEAKGNLICNPNCSTAAGVMALYEIHKKFGLEEIVYSTYQAVSGAGKVALDDIKTKKQEKLKSFVFPIYDNLIPQIGTIDEYGNSTEENKMLFETRKILGDSEIKIAATCVRVPITVCHSLSIHFKTKCDATLQEIIDTLKNTHGVTVVDNAPDFPMPFKTKGQDDVLVGRIRNSFEKNAFDIFVCSDNLRKGAAQNGVQILEMFLREEK